MYLWWVDVDSFLMLVRVVMNGLEENGVCLRRNEER